MPQSKYITVNNIKLHYLERGEGEAVLLLHGFPTSSHLWRNIIPKIAASHRVIALDLPGYGKSEKPLSVSYSLNYYDKIITTFLSELKVDKVNLIVHDLGGPIGLLWAVRHPQKIKSIGLLNTVIYPDFSWGVILFSLAARLPLLKNWLSSPSGITLALRIGTVNKTSWANEIIKAYQEPFVEKNARRALIKTVTNMSIKGFKEVENKLTNFEVPIRIIYGENDWILPKIKNTMSRVKRDLPQAEITSIPNCGHFLQEDQPELVSELLSRFLNE